MNRQKLTEESRKRAFAASERYWKAAKRWKDVTEKERETLETASWVCLFLWAGILV